jgi:prepilin signal peptidase PulO-like enzyme (type II secretory pathway)
MERIQKKTLNLKAVYICGNQQRKIRRKKRENLINWTYLILEIASTIEAGLIWELWRRERRPKESEKSILYIE